MIEALRPTVAGARWVPPENLHATLFFLGRVDDEAIPSIDAVLRDATSRHEPIDSALDGLGAFPNARRARVVWIGLRDDGERLRAVAASVNAALEPLGYRAEARPFRSHVTLARLRAPGPAALSVDLEPVPVPVDSITLFESHLGLAGARYKPRAVYPLGT